MIFLDANNYFIHAELNQQIDALKADIEFYESTLERDRELLKQLNTNPEAFETYARENFKMHKEGETVTFIEFEDSFDGDVKKRSYPHGKVVEPLYTSSPDNNVGFKKSSLVDNGARARGRKRNYSQRLGA